MHKGKLSDLSNLSKLSRAELLEIMVSQSEEIDRMSKRIEELEKKLQDRELAMKNVGSIAEAALVLNNIFEDAQKAAEMYLENVKIKAGIN